MKSDCMSSMSSEVKGSDYFGRHVSSGHEKMNIKLIIEGLKRNEHQKLPGSYEVTGVNGILGIMHVSRC